MPKDFRLQDLIDIPKLQALLDSLYVSSGIPSGIIDLEGNILAGAGWQDLCTKFHRVHPESRKDCIHSDTTIAAGISSSEAHAQVTCPRGLTDTATPLIIEGRHLANVFTGQLFVQEPDPESFRQQARQFGFEEGAYFEAFKKVPVITQKQLDAYLTFIAQLTEQLATQGLTHLRTLRTQEALQEAHQKLQSSEERFKQVFHAMPVAISIATFEEGRFLVVNQALETVFGYAAKDLEGRTSVEVGIWENPEDRAAIVSSFKKGEIIRDLEAQIRRKDGQVRWVAFSGEEITLNGLACLLMSTVDITERKRADATIKENEARFRAFIEQAPTSIGVFNLDGECLYANQKYVEVLGLQDAESFVGHKALETIAPQCREESKERTRRRLAGLPVPSEFESIALRTDGTEFPVQMAVAPIHLSNGPASIVFLTDISERRMSEQLLRASEGKYHSLYRDAAIGIFYSTFDGKFIDINPALARLLGYDSPEEAVRCVANISEQVYAVPQERDLMAASAMEADGFITTENAFKHRDGSIWWGRLQMRIVQDPQGKPSHFEGFVEDITKRKQAEEALKGSEIRYRQLFEAIPESVLLIGTDRRVVAANQTAARLHGYDSPQQLEGFDTRLLIAEKDRGRSAQIQSKLFQGVEQPARQYTEVRRDGSEFIAEVISTTLHGPNQEVTGYIGITRDITAFVEAENEIKEYQLHLEARNQDLQLMTERLRLATSGAGIGVWDWDIVQNDLLWDDSMYRIYAIHPEGVGNAYESWLHAIHPDDKAFAEGEIQAALRGEREYAPEFRILWPDGSVRYLRAASKTFFDQEGKPIRMVGINLDITEPRAAEEERIKLQAQLMQSQKMESLGSLAGGMAHDMNNVLGAILGMATANIEAQAVGSPAYRAFDTITKAAMRGGKMVKGLLSFARQSSVEERELDINQVLREETQMLERTALATVRLEMDLASDLRPIRGDASALTHAFMNLCVNAVDAMPENGTLTLRTRNVDNDWIEIMVQDTGTGMPKEVLDKALDPFFTTKEVGKGTGLGLPMVHRTVTAHHGQMEILSEPGQGTCILLRFPACEPASQASASFAGREATVSQKPGLSILVIDDDELIQMTLQALLEIQGHEATIASSGEEALDKLEAGFQPQVVILDMNMPGLGGAGTLPRLRALRPTLPVLLATGRVDESASTLAAAHPHVTLLPKPYSMEELKQQLEPIGRG